MATIIIDQKPYEIDPKSNLLEIAISLGLDLPYFCWHPALGSVGSCRQCAVQQLADESDSQGRTVMACMTPVKEGARFSIEHPTCTGFRKSVIEWMMINHPLDCPVCDEGGECHLQDMTVMTGHENRRYRFLKRTFRNQNLGPFINHEMNRCITCYRCVRYYKDVAGGIDLSAFASSGRVYFGRHEEGALINEFSGNLVEVCPTGVFTDKVFHQHHTRKWDLETSPSVCQLCSVGCNISPGERSGMLRRVQNRYHHHVNGYFICDRGRFGHEFVNAKERIKKPVIRRGQSLLDISMGEAYTHIQSLTKSGARMVGIGSPRASLEANWMLRHWVGSGHFYDGLLAVESTLLGKTIACLESQAVEPASLSDIRKADAILILGEDVTNTAPMIALSIRQAAVEFKRAKSLEEQNIPAWNDAAVRDYARGDLLPIFSANAFTTSIDQMAQATLITHPFDLVDLTRALWQTLKGENVSAALSEAAKAWLTKTISGLLAAKKPVIITGASLGEPNLIELARVIANLLDSKNQGQTRLSLVMGEANSIGLGLLKPKPLTALIEHLKNQPVDVAIVLENDLRWRLGTKPFLELCQGIKNLVVIDSLPSDTAKHASLVLPCLTFAESTGTMVSQEGRLQRYFSVFKSGFTGVESSWRMLVSCMGPEAEKLWQKTDDICAAMAADFGISQVVFDELYKGDFKVMGRGIPRQTSEFSGRTAMYANVTMHEPKPPRDPDSPLLYSMEGARKKVPLPLISSSWEPRWNSVQASFPSDLSAQPLKKNESDGVRLFQKSGAAVSGGEPLTHPKKYPEFPEVYVLPRHHIFGSEQRANFSPSLATRIPLVEAHIAESEAKRHGFLAGARLMLETKGGKYALVAKTDNNLPPGILVLPFGLVDASLFYQPARVHVVNEESV